MRLPNTQVGENSNSTLSKKTINTTFDGMKLRKSYKLQNGQAIRKVCVPRKLTCDDSEKQLNQKLKMNQTMCVTKNSKNIQNLKSQCKKKFTFNMKKLLKEERKKFYAKKSHETVGSSSRCRKISQFGKKQKTLKKGTLTRGRTTGKNSTKNNIPRKFMMRNSSKHNYSDEPVMPLEVENKPRRFLSPVPGKRSVLHSSEAQSPNLCEMRYYNGVLVSAKGFTLYLNKEISSPTTPIPDRRKISQLGKRMNMYTFSPTSDDRKPNLPSLPENFKCGFSPKIRIPEARRNISSPFQKQSPFNLTVKASSQRNSPILRGRLRRMQHANFSSYANSVMIGSQNTESTPSKFSRKSPKEIHEKLNQIIQQCDS
ncbi:unnamed protein product [Moneuplotes crassus]|uniref:Uncharacterized protein n=1 Tax=Euplotes crassus TaxID=5936 RepID=A0AAD1U7C7_EUPCR|nr:unnamed protein product [Moneuplotes crassus]